MRSVPSIWFLPFGLCLPLAGCAEEGSTRSGSEPSIAVVWSSELAPESAAWYTNPPAEADIRYRLSRQDSLSFGDLAEDGTYAVRLDPSVRHQSLIGFGTSLEATTIYAIRKGATDAQQRVILRDLIDPDQGLGFSLFRIAFGTSDFSDGRSVSTHPQGYYSYQDQENEPFSIQNDIELGIVDVLKKTVETANDLGQEIRIFASSWSAPPWMKTSGALIGGTLKPGFEHRLAAYYRQAIEAYEAQGIPIYAMTMQNEPNFVPTAYPGMQLSWRQERDLVVATYEAFHHPPDGGRPLDTRLWINDHNFDDWANADSVLASLGEMGKKQVVDAVAFHNYNDAPASNMATLQQRHPETDLVFTEHSEWGAAGMYHIQEYFWNGARTYAYWVTFTTEDLDEHNQGPYNAVGELSPTLMIRREGSEPSWYRTPEYFLLGQFGRYLRPGAERIACDRGSPEAVTAVAFRNPDGRIAVVVVNQSEMDQAFKLVRDSRQAVSNLPAKTVGTYVWQE